MLERRSALATARPYTSPVLRMGEARGFTLTQAAGLSPDFEKRLAAVAGELPAKVGVAVASKGRTVLRVGPRQFWLVGPETDDLATKLMGVCAATPLSHSRTRIFLEGAPARAVLAKGMALDFHESAFTPGGFAMTGVHHMPLLVHCVSADRFDLYAMRTFAMSVWDWLADAALEFAG
ncbi:MAG: hypothetical protein HY245_16015 [Rhizobiales bacterium]|nr:hypothetical protein [Hyphomicrobiales bacterium]MBI3674890.1 hypothetical protein [Hyphomicrobiales bacterium]